MPNFLVLVSERAKLGGSNLLAKNFNLQLISITQNASLIFSLIVPYGAKWQITVAMESWKPPWFSIECYKDPSIN